MNIIGNCCIGSFLLRKYGFGNTNPFTWTIIDFETFYNLITNYENIDWDNFELARREHPHPAYKGQYVYEIIINKNIRITYFHFLFDANAKSPLINGADVRYCKIWEYIVQKYVEHCKIMKNENKKPVFVCNWEHIGYDEEDFYKLYNTDIRYKCIVITNNEKLKKLHKHNLYIIYDKNKKGSPPEGCLPSYFANKYANDIKRFIEEK